MSPIKFKFKAKLTSKNKKSLMPENKKKQWVEYLEYVTLKRLDFNNFTKMLVVVMGLVSGRQSWASKIKGRIYLSFLSISKN